MDKEQIIEKLKQNKIDREVDEHNETHDYRLGYVEAMNDAINLVNNLSIQIVINSDKAEIKEVINIGVNKGDLYL
tara:strand:+ start:543 stop:767 length:225 start_codon:yes stop_codon:yes gene_type:complete